jgi:hypothetical protein
MRGARPRKALKLSRAPAGCRRSRALPRGSGGRSRRRRRRHSSNAEGVGRQHLGPVVAVVAGRVAAVEDVREAVRVAVEGGAGQIATSRRTSRRRSASTRSAAPGSVCSRMSNSANSTRAAPAARSGSGAPRACGRRARAAAARRCRHARSGARSTGHSQQKFSMNWLGSSTASHSTPRCPRHAALVDLRQQVVQPVAELVEQRQHVVVGQQRRPVADRAPRSCTPGGHRRLQRPSGRRQRARSSSIQAPACLPGRA